MIDKLNKIEAQGLAAAATETTSPKKKDSALVHQSDSTTKKFEGKFQVSGVQLNGHLIPFPTILLSGETKGELAEQVALGFHFLEAARGIDAADIYKEVDAHMADTTSHNKGIRENVAKLLNLDKKVGQLFSSTHTNLGFCRSMNVSIRAIETLLLQSMPLSLICICHKAYQMRTWELEW